jgi:hypothetical protein
MRILRVADVPSAPTGGLQRVMGPSREPGAGRLPAGAGLGQGTMLPTSARASR